MNDLRNLSGTCAFYCVAKFGTQCRWIYAPHIASVRCGGIDRNGLCNLGEVLTVFQALQNALSLAGRIDDDNLQFHRRTRGRYLRTGFRSKAYGKEHANQDSENCSPRVYKRSFHRRKKSPNRHAGLFICGQRAPAAQILNTIASTPANVYHGQPGKLREH